MTRMIALLRGINVGGHRKVPMTDLRTLAREEEFGDPQTYLASGNLILSSELSAGAIESVLERAVADRFGFDTHIVVRTAAQWHSYLANRPFISEGVRDPNFVMLCLGKQAATDTHLATVRATARGDERVERRGDALWLYFAAGAGRSNMTLGPKTGIWTTRNLRSVEAIAGLLTG